MPHPVTMVAAVARNGVIGRDGDLPWSLPGDLARFKALTMGGVLVMGRRTYDSIGRPLPGRTTVVITRDGGWQPAAGPHPDVVVAASLTEALVQADLTGAQVFVVGGGQVYAEALAHVDRLVITWVDQSPAGDTVFPAFDTTHWDIVATREHDGCSVVTYQRADQPESISPSGVTPAPGAAI